mmetsp:Transcript_32714/g.77088  ORF Transcript_32714/g.77088 Transcript_32714/m.77088 type:complete len:255 (+) Transcript_32714:2521-3285(+)
MVLPWKRGETEPFNPTPQLWLPVIVFPQNTPAQLPTITTPLCAPPTTRFPTKRGAVRSRSPTPAICAPRTSFPKNEPLASSWTTIPLPSLSKILLFRKVASLCSPHCNPLVCLPRTSLSTAMTVERSSTRKPHPAVSRTLLPWSVVVESPPATTPAAGPSAIELSENTPLALSARRSAASPQRRNSHRRMFGAARPPTNIPKETSSNVQASIVGEDESQTSIPMACFARMVHFSILTSLSTPMLKQDTSGHAAS